MAKKKTTRRRRICNWKQLPADERAEVMQALEADKECKLTMSEVSERWRIRPNGLWLVIRQARRKFGYVTSLALDGSELTRQTRRRRRSLSAYNENKPNEASAETTAVVLDDDGIDNAFLREENSRLRRVNSVLLNLVSELTR